jgi:hypothetical protein
MVTQFLLEGPMNQRFHKYWNKRTDAVEITGENRDDIREEDAAYYTPNEYSSNANNNNTVSIGTPGTMERNLRRLDAQFNDNLTLTVNTDDRSTQSSKASKTGSIYTPTHKPRVTLRVDTDVRSVTSNNTHSTRTSKKSTKSQASYLHTASKLVPTNSDSWLAVEEKVFQEIFSLASQLETNKSLTQETPLPGGMQEVRRNCRYLARMRAKSMKEIVQAIEDEKCKDAVRDVSFVFIQPTP